MVGLPELEANPVFSFSLMRAFTFAAAGCLVGILLAAGSIFLLGLLLQSFGIQLYDSESGQQRNFNFALIIIMAIALLGAWLGFRLGKR